METKRPATLIGRIIASMDKLDDEQIDTLFLIVVMAVSAAIILGVNAIRYFG